MMATLRQVERIALGFPGGSTSETYILNTSLLDTSKAFLVFGVRVDDPDSGQYLFSGEITNATTCTFSRSVAGPAAEIVGYVAEFTSGVAVDRGTFVSSASPGGPYQSTLVNATDLSKAFVIVPRDRSGSGYGDDDVYTARLFDDAGTKKIEVVQQRDNDGTNYKWQAVQYDDCVVQRGNTSMSSGQTSVTVNLSVAVNTAKAFPLIYHREPNGTTANIGQKLLRARFNGDSQIIIDRDNTGNPVTDIRWEVVEFTDGVTVQEVLSGFAATDGLNDQTITPVSGLDKVIAIASDQAHRGKGNRSDNDVLGESMFTMDITSVSNLQIQRAATVGSADVAAYVVDFGASGGATTLPFILQHYHGGIG